VPDFAAALVAAFLPLFVAINIPGILPLYIGMTETFTADDRRQLLIRALLAALVLAVLMLFAGQVIFDTLGITLNDLRVGGGLILLVIAVTDLAFGDTKDRRGGKKKDREKLAEHEEGEPVDLPVVPLGIPLIIGPGAITTILITDGAYGWVVTLASIVLNMALVFVAFTFGPSLLRLFGPGTSKAVAKVASLFLAAISVAMIRAGVLGMIGAV
jgi:multiple antibiotic resistance protein